MNNDRRGCLEGLFQIAIVSALFNWMQKKFGFGRGASCSGCGCGLILLIIFVILLCSIVGGTDWFHLMSPTP